MVKVKLVGFDDRGKTKLSMKVVDQETVRGPVREVRRRTRRPRRTGRGRAWRARGPRPPPRPRPRPRPPPPPGLIGYGRYDKGPAGVIRRGLSW